MGALLTTSHNPMGLTGARGEGDRRALDGCSGHLGTCFKGTQKGLKAPLGVLGAKLPSVWGLELSDCPLLCPMHEHSLAATSSLDFSVSELQRKDSPAEVPVQVEHTEWTGNAPLCQGELTSDPCQVWG